MARCFDNDLDNDDIDEMVSRGGDWLSNTDAGRLSEEVGVSEKMVELSYNGGGAGGTTSSDSSSLQQLPRTPLTSYAHRSGPW